MSLNYLEPYAASSTLAPEATALSATARNLTNVFLQFDSPLDVLRIPFRFAYVIERLLVLTFTTIGRWLGLPAVWRGLGKLAAGIWSFIAGPIGPDMVGVAAMANTSKWDRFWDVFGLQSIRNLGGLFTYFTSRWAFACFTVVSRTLGELCHNQHN